MKRELLFVLFGVLMFSFPGLLGSQDVENLVPNPSFETKNGKLRRSGQIEKAKFWFPATAEEPDLYSRDVDKEEIGSPENYRGYCKPRTGRRFAGFRAYSFRDDEPRTYLTAELPNKLNSGVTYCVTMYVSLSDLSKYAVNNLGIYLTKNDIVVDEEKSLIYEAQVKDPKNKIYKNRRLWKPLCKPYTAKGGEEYITIGNFTPNDKLETEKMRRMKRFKQPQIFDAYYYVDDVSIKAVDNEAECSCKEKDKKKGKEMKYVYSKKSTVSADIPPKKRIRQSTIYFPFFSTELQKNAKETLDSIAKIMKENPGLKLDIIGHSDPQEQKKVERADNLKEKSKHRAEVIKDHLAAKGIAERRMKVIAKKDKDPADSGSTTLARAKNRRVEFVARE